jgi:hypothetical protein
MSAKALFCTEIPLEERCDGCPLTMRQQDETKQELSPYMLYRLTVVTEPFLSDLDPQVTQSEYVEGQLAWGDTLEPAYQHIGRLGRDIANWKIVGGCDYHDGAIIRDPELEQRLEQFFGKISLEQGE